MRAFWFCLTAVDPLVCLLLVLRRRSGVLLGLLVLLVDVCVNWRVAGPTGGLARQAVFAVIAAVTAPVLWAWFGRRSGGGRHP